MRVAIALALLCLFLIPSFALGQCAGDATFTFIAGVPDVLFAGV